MTQIDQYMILSLARVSDEYHVKLLSPLKLKPGHKAKIALCECTFKNDNEQFYNIERNSGVEVAIPRYTTSVKKETRDDTQSKDDKETRDDKITVEFESCHLEQGEYSPQTLCDALNANIKSKFPSEFQEDQCKILWNETINKVELRLDGNVRGIAPDLRVTLIIYPPMSQYLGFSGLDQPRSYCFVSIIISVASRSL